MPATASEFRELYLLYCIDLQPGGVYNALNRHHAPLGFNGLEGIDHVVVAVRFEFKRPLTRLQVIAISFNRDPSPHRIHLYEFEAIPPAYGAVWDDYCRRYELLVSLLAGR